MGKTVLVVEDDQDIRNYYEIVLSDLNLDLVQTTNGQEAFQVIDSGRHFDLIILDIVMPVMDGEKFLRELRQNRHLSIPVIISSVDEISAERLKKVAEVQGVFFKLHKVDELRTLISKSLEHTTPLSLS